MGQQCVVVLDFWGRHQKYVLEYGVEYSVAVHMYQAGYLLLLMKRPGCGRIIGWVC